MATPSLRVLASFFIVSSGAVFATDPTYTISHFSPVTLVQTAAVDRVGNVYTFANHTALLKFDRAGVKTTLAGVDGQMGSADGTGPSALFKVPGGITVDEQGNVYVADSWNQTIRKVTPAGVVTTLAGSPGQAGSVDGSGALARFSNPDGIVIDGNGVIFVADSVNQLIRKITSTGSVTTFAGSPGQAGSTDGSGTAARFNYPTGLALDRAGNLYVVENGNHTVRKITPFGMVSTFAGNPGSAGSSDGIGSAARFFYPNGLGIDLDDNLYVADSGNNTIRKITPSGVVTTIAGVAGQQGDVDGEGVNARFFTPFGVAVDREGTLYIPDGNNHSIRKGVPSIPLRIRPSITWMQPQAITEGTALSSVQLGAAANVPGTFSYSPAAGTQLSAGTHVLTAVFTPADESVYAATSAEVSIHVDPNKVVPILTWAQPAEILQDVALSPIQLNAVSNVPGAFSYSPALGSVLSPGVNTLTVTFTPLDTSTYASVTLQTTITVRPVYMGRLANISVRANCDAGDRVVIGGFVIGGTGLKRVLVRAVGASLASQGVPQGEVLNDPAIDVYDSQHGNSIFASNDDWQINPNPSEIASTSAKVGAAALVNGDAKSSALLLSLSPGVYTVAAKSKPGSPGIVLLELYDADVGSSSSKFVNISSRTYAKSANGVAISGFVVGGTTEKQILLRGVGPSLAKQGVSAVEIMEDPMIELHDAIHGNAVIAANDNWTDNADLSAVQNAIARVGAAPFDTTDKKSSALLLKLKPGVYTFVASGKSATSGIILMEVYEVE